MHGLIRNFSYQDILGYQGDVVKGFVSDIAVNDAGIYVFDVCAGRAPNHDEISNACRTPIPELIIEEVIEDELLEHPLDLKFQIEPPLPLTIEIIAWDTLPEDETILERVAVGLWSAINTRLPVQSPVMLIKNHLDSPEEFQRIFWCIGRNGRPKKIIDTAK